MRNPFFASSKVVVRPAPGRQQFDKNRRPLGMLNPRREKTGGTCTLWGRRADTCNRGSSIEWKTTVIFVKHNGIKLDAGDGPEVRMAEYYGIGDGRHNGEERGRRNHALLVPVASSVAFRARLTLTLWAKCERRCRFCLRAKLSKLVEVKYV